MFELVELIRFTLDSVTYVYSVITSYLRLVGLRQHRATPCNTHQPKLKLSTANNRKSDGRDGSEFFQIMMHILG